MEAKYFGTESVVDSVGIISIFLDLSVYLKSFDTAFNHPDFGQRVKRGHFKRFQSTF
jgi:hypothetical protein